MTLKLFADHCISNSIIQSLLDAGCEVFRMRNYLPTDSPDQMVISKARELDSILVSLNGDFADIITYPPSDHKGSIALQVKNHPEAIPHILERLKALFSTHVNMEYYSGKLLLVEAHRIRIRD